MERQIGTRSYAIFGCQQMSDEEPVNGFLNEEQSNQMCCFEDMTLYTVQKDSVEGERLHWRET